MSRPPAPVKGIYQRDDDASGNWYARFRINGKLDKKSFGADHTAAIEYGEKARMLRRVAEGHVPKPVGDWNLPEDRRERVLAIHGFRRSFGSA